MRWRRGGWEGLPRWAAALVPVIGGSVFVYLLVCLLLVVYLWLGPIVF
jgi:hypothetical protein